MEPQNNQPTQPTATAPAPAPAAAPAPAPAPAVPTAPVAAAPVKAGSKLPMWLLVVFALVVVGGVAYYLMS